MHIVCNMECAWARYMFVCRIWKPSVKSSIRYSSYLLSFPCVTLLWFVNVCQYNNQDIQYVQYIAYNLFHILATFGNFSENPFVVVCQRTTKLNNALWFPIFTIVPLWSDIKMTKTLCCKSFYFHCFSCLTRVISPVTKLIDTETKTNKCL